MINIDNLMNILGLHIDNLEIRNNVYNNYIEFISHIGMQDNEIINNFGLTSINKSLSGKLLFGKYKKDSISEKILTYDRNSRYDKNTTEAYDTLFSLLGIENNNDITWMYIEDILNTNTYIPQSNIYSNEDEYIYIVFDADKIKHKHVLEISTWEKFIDNRYEGCESIEELAMSINDSYSMNIFSSRNDADDFQCIAKVDTSAIMFTCSSMEDVIHYIKNSKK